ncbi:MAG: hypothetical protein UT11_C0017G0018 [Berkelbacteria bacterium GW2011_GWA2_38_9]|uniref:ABC transporter permease n=1 Tax=Berkelbacteria bacterium GW2011_GWA2_38_9 TaxID=1618334 RepID=A0A0G0LPJ1_9BACT|nr:MAG: hypothetical protein UT11_C0017G0018 [Berkelbacteria bacterium GW2011_GWA2_38_9]
MFLTNVFAYFKLSWLYTLQYRASLLIVIVARLVSTSFIVFLWIKIYQSQNVVGGYTLSGMLTYYLLAFIIKNIIKVDISKSMAQKIKDGTMQFFILRPGGIIGSFFGWNIAKTLIQTGILGVVICIIYIFFHQYFVFQFTYFTVVGFFILVSGGFVLAYLMATFISAITFWLIEIAPLLNSFAILTGILSGSTIPLSFFPGKWGSVIMFLPFRYLTYDPIRMIQGQISSADFPTIFLAIIIWILFFYLLNIWIWHIGLKRFDAVGN